MEPLIIFSQIKIMPKVSIIVPVYNVEKYLDRCVQSLINQTLKDIEIILVDDGSPDNCPGMCDNYAKTDKRIKVIHKKNAGLGFARNSGLKIANGEYVAFCDSDDYVKLDSYEILYNFAKSKNVDVVFGSFFKETSPGVWTELRKVESEVIYQNEQVKEYVLDMVACAPYVKIERKHDMSSCMSLYRKRIIDDFNIRFLSERENGSEDTTFNIEYLKKANSIAQIPYTFYYYCLNESSLSMTYHPDKFERFVVLRKQMIEFLSDWDSNHERANRFFIGYARSFIICMFNDSSKGCIDNIKRMVGNSVWEEIKIEYKCEYLPIIPRLVYWLTINQRIRVLAVVGYFLSKLWKIKQKIK